MISSAAVLVLLFVWTPFVLSQDGGCPSGYTAYGSSCYAFVDHSMTWTAAQSTCGALGGFLAEIFSDGENSFVQKMASDHHATAIWLGGDDLLAEGQWAWSKSGALIEDYNDWASGQPDNDKDGDENCMEMNIDKFDSHWNDDECFHKQPFVCQRVLGDFIVGR